MIDIFQYDFMQRALVAGLAIAIIAPLIGLFLVVRRYSYLADTLAHVSLVGVSLGLVTNTNPMISALVVSSISAWGIERLRSTRKILSESLLAIFLSGSLAISVLIIASLKRFNQDLFSYLFGSITTVSHTDVTLIIVLAVVTLIGIIVLFKELFLVSLNEELARAEGLRVGWLNIFLIVMSAVSISLAMRIVGVLLIGALMVIPVTAAMQFRLSFKKTMITAVIISLLATLSGLYVSFYLDVPSGATIVVLTLVILLISLAVNSRCCTSLCRKRIV